MGNARVRTAIAAICCVLSAGVASGQTPPLQTPQAQMPPPLQSPAPLTKPKPPVAPTVPRAATQTRSPDVETEVQLVLMQSAQVAQADLRSLMETLTNTNREKAAQRAATSNPCEREGLGAALSCIDAIKRLMSRTAMPAAAKTQLDADLAVLRDGVREAQFGSAKQRAARLAEVKTRADRIDASLAKLAEPRAPAAIGLPLDKLIPGLGD